MYIVIYGERTAVYDVFMMMPEDRHVFFVHVLCPVTTLKSSMCLLFILRYSQQTNVNCHTAPSVPK